jgi:hypothetical protein
MRANAPKRTGTAITKGVCGTTVKFPSTGFLHPPEDFLDSFPLSLAYLVTGVSGRALVQPPSAATLVLSDMRRDSHVSQFLDELALSVIGRDISFPGHGADEIGRTSG